MMAKAVAASLSLAAVFLHGCGSDDDTTSSTTTTTTVPKSTCQKETWTVAPYMQETPCPEDCGCTEGEVVEKQRSISMLATTKGSEVLSLMLSGNDTALAGQTWSSVQMVSNSSVLTTILLESDAAKGQQRCMVMSQEKDTAVKFFVAENLETCWTCSLHNTTKTQAWEIYHSTPQDVECPSSELAV